MKFAPLFQVDLAHSYYADRRCPDVLIQPTPETQAQLRNYRCIFKSDPSGFRVLTALNAASDPFIPMPEGTTFTFTLMPQNPDFSLFTDLTTLASTPTPVYTNAKLEAGQGPGKPQALDLVSRSSQEQPKQPTRHPAGVLAHVEMRKNASLPASVADGPGVFYIPFEAKHAHWMYYVVTDRNTNGDVFQIGTSNGTNPAPSIIFSPENSSHLNQDPDPSDSVAQALAEQYPSLQRFRFVSDTALPFQQRVSSPLQLSLNGNPLFARLPIPSPRNYAQIHFETNGSLQQQDGVFHILKWFSQPFATSGK